MTQSGGNVETNREGSLGAEEEKQRAGGEEGLRTPPSIPTAPAVESVEAKLKGEQPTAGEKKLPDGAKEGQRSTDDLARVLDSFNVGNTTGRGGVRGAGVTEAEGTPI